MLKLYFNNIATKLYQKAKDFVVKRNLQRFFIKKSKSFNFPYKVHSALDFYTDHNVYKNFTIVGKNWRDYNNKTTRKPLILCIGMNDWKYGFIAEYLADYRTIFSRRKIENLRFIFNFFRLEERPNIFIVWGYKETFWIKILAYFCKIKIYRMEDGFIRSAGLGALHYTPYSLVLDKKGLYYNAHQPSDIETILNEHDFSADIQLLQQADHFIKEIKEHKISKYNLSHETPHKISFVKFKKKVLVIGQVEGDAALRYGNPDKWTIKKLLYLAKAEHKDAEIIYRPHPETYNKMQKELFHLRDIASFVTISPPDILLNDFLQDIDHVYTISSLSGFEALIYGKKVTTVGTPFYAGWGCTDDRATFKRRTRQLSFTELFAGSYLKYPTYLADINDNIKGLNTTLERIKIDRNIMAIPDINTLEVTSLTCIYQKIWYLLFAQNQEKKRVQLLTKMDFAYLIPFQGNIIFEKINLYMIYGALTSSQARELFLGKIRKYMTPSIYHQFLNDIVTNDTVNLVKKQKSWLFYQTNNPDYCDILENFDKDAQDIHVDYQLSTQIYTETNEPQSALSMLLRHIVAHNPTLSDFHKIAHLCMDLFNHQAAYFIGCVTKFSDIQAKKTTSLALIIKNYGFDNTRKKQDFIDACLMLSLMEPSATLASLLHLPKIEDPETETHIIKNLQNIHKLDNNYTSQKVYGMLALGEYEYALEVAENVLLHKTDTDAHIIAYSQALTYLDHKEKAYDLIKKYLDDRKSLMMYREFFRICILLGYYEIALSYLQEAQNMGHFMTEMYYKKIYFGNRMIKEAMHTFTMSPFSAYLKTYCPEKYTPELQDNHSNILIFNMLGGPGDEIRFTHMYHHILEHVPNSRISMTCDPRLHNIFSKSFPQITFYSVKRVVRAHERYNIEDYNALPYYKLSSIMDNKSIDLIKKYDQISSIPDLLHQYLYDYSQFKGTPTLKHNPEMTENFKEQLPKDKVIVGLSWRSSLQTTARNEHYLCVKDLHSLFEIKDVIFVNLQYDSCDEELQWVQDQYPDKMINFEDIDQYNDFDSVASLMKATDIIISPATTVFELAGALGCHTILASNSSEFHYRKINDKNQDMWNHNAFHVEGDTLGDKISLINNLSKQLKQYVQAVRNN